MDALTTLFTGAPTADTPNATRVGSEFSGVLQDYLGAQPQILATQQEYQPQYTALDLQTLEQSLNGSNGTPGVLGEYAGNILPTVTRAVNTANSATRAGNAQDLATLGPGTVASVKALNPGAAALSDQLTQTAADQLKLGTQLDPNQMRQIDQTVTGNWANRGLGTSDPAQLDEALKYFGAGQSLLGQREAAAGSAAAQATQLFTDPAFQVLTGTSSAPGVAAGVTSTGTNVAGAGATPIVSPQMADSMLGTVYNANASTNIANANTAAGVAGGEFSALGNLGGSALSAQGMAASGGGSL